MPPRPLTAAVAHATLAADAPPTALPLAATGALTLAAATFVGFEALGHSPWICAGTTFTLALPWLLFGGAAHDRRGGFVRLVAAGIPLAGLNAALACAMEVGRHHPREAVGMGIAALLFGVLLWGPALLLALVVGGPVIVGATGARLPNRDRRSAALLTTVGALASVMLAAAAFHAIAFRSGPYAVDALFPLAAAAAAIAALAAPLARHRIARAELVAAAVHLPLGEGAADGALPLLGPGPAATHALYAPAAASYRGAPQEPFALYAADR